MPASFIKHNGVWVRDRPDIKQGGTWKSAKPYVKLGGTWRPAWSDFTPGIFATGAATQHLQRSLGGINTQKWTYSLWVWASGYASAAYSPPTWPTWAQKRFWDQNSTGLQIGVSTTNGGGYVYVRSVANGWETRWHPLWSLRPVHTQKWMHLLFQIDTTQPVTGNRVKFFLDGAAVAYHPTLASTFPAFNAFVPVGSGSQPSLCCKQDNFVSVHRWAFIQGFFGAVIAPTQVAFNWDGVWTHKPFVGSRSGLDFTLAGTGGFIAQDISGNNLTFTGVNMTAGANLSTFPSFLPPWIA